MALDEPDVDRGGRETLPSDVRSPKATGFSFAEPGVLCQFVLGVTKVREIMAAAAGYPSSGSRGELGRIPRGHGRSPYASDCVGRDLAGCASSMSATSRSWRGHQTLRSARVALAAGGIEPSPEFWRHRLTICMPPAIQCAFVLVPLCFTQSLCDV